MSTKFTDTKQFLADLNGGVFSEQIGVAISEAARGSVNFGANGKVVITLDFKRIAQSNQANVKCGLKFIAPTAKGRKTEEYTSETPVYVNSDSDVTLFPKDQGQLFDTSGKAHQKA